MAISLDLFASRLEHACQDMEDAMRVVSQEFIGEVRVLATAAGGAEPHEQLAFKAILEARLAELERRIAEALSV